MNKGLPDKAQLKLQSVDATMPAVEAERTARFLAAQSPDALADLVAAELKKQSELLRTVRDIEARVFVLNRALELHRYREA